MIPTSTNGHMPFLSPHSNHSTAARKSLNIPDANRAPTSPRNSGTHSPIQRSPPILNGMDLSNGMPVLSKDGREEILKRDHSWKAFLKALFRSKHKKQSASNSSLETTLTITLTPPESTSGKMNQRIGHQNLRRPRTRQCPLQRCNSLNATSRHIADLEAIIEEESSHSQIDVNDSCMTLKDVILSAPNTINRVRPSSEYVGRRSILESENFEERIQVLSPVSPSKWVEGDNNNESVHPEISTWRSMT